MEPQIFRRLSIASKMLVIVCVFVAIIICVFALGVIRSEILTGVRTSIGGESLWSKAEKQAVLSLTKYAASHDERDYQRYLSEIAVPIGDRQGREQLQRASPDWSLVARGFVQGRNNPEDVDSMAMLFRRFGRIGYMQRAIAIWIEGDYYIEQLRTQADTLHREIASGHSDPQTVQQITDRVAAIDAQLTPLEDDFSFTLAQGARSINRVLALATAAATALLALLGIALSLAVLRRVRNSEEKYHNLINTASDAILVIDVESGRIVEANHKAGELFGLAVDRLIGMPESSLYPTDAATSPHLASEFPQELADRELIVLRADGACIPVEVSASRTELARRPAILGIFRDIRDRVQAADELRRTENRFSYLIQNLSDVITVVAVDGTMVYHGPSIERTTGYKPSELLGKSFLSFIHADDEPAVRAALERVTLNTGTAAPPEYRFRHRDGSWVWFESVGNNLLNDVAVGGIVVTSRDVSGRRVLEEQVRQSQKMEAVGRLAGGIAHDFNNLLMVIRGYAEIVLQEESATPAVRKSVDTIVRTTESAANLTRQLLSFSRRHAFNPQALDLNQLVDRMSEMLLGLLREEMQFEVKLDPAAGTISADPGQIEQVIMNLVVNARDAMPRGGKLTLQTAHVAVDAVRADSSYGVPAGDYVMLAVSDTGVGMDADTQSRIFEPFFTTKNKDKGTGLGLSVVYNIVRGTGGHVGVSSEPGRGSTLRILFPRIAAAPKPPAAETLKASPLVGNETILVAEDQPDLLWMICQYLQTLGYSVLEAKDGGDAIALADQYKGGIDILLTDVVMPHVRGPEVARRLSATRPDMKVIFMSGYTEGEFGDPEQENSGGAPILLQKPFELDFLAQKIHEVLKARTRR